MVVIVNIICSDAFSTKRVFFQETFFVLNHTGTRKKSLKIKSQNDMTLFSEIFL